MKNPFFTLFCCCIFSFPLSLFSQDTITITDDDLQAGGSYTWTRNNVYLLEGPVFLEQGGMLTIEAGTVIKGKKGTDEAGFPAGLIITRGAKIFAEGGPCDPIIFTYEGDDPDNPDDLTQTERGLWGGLALLGRGPLPEVCEDAFRGASPDDSRARYGGDPNCVFDDDDNSGVLRYVSIRHAGFDYGDQIGFDALFLGAVGRQTVVEHVEVYASGLSGIVISGGNVNLKYAVAGFPAQDAFVWEKGWNGNGQFWFGIHGTDSANRGGDHQGLFQGITSNPIIYNATFIGAGGESLEITQDGESALSFLENSAGEYSNSIITEFTGYALKVEDTPDSSNDSYNQLVKGELRLKNNLWWTFGVNNSSDVAFSDVISPNPEGDDPENDALLSHLLQFGNDLQNPFLNGISRTAENSLDPRPGEGPAFENLAALPAGNPFFDQVNHKGAFGDDLWLYHWTALDANLHLVQSPVCSLAVTFTKEDVSCFQSFDGQINLNITGAIGPVVIDWDTDNLDGQQTPGGLPAGDYFVTVTDGNCCSQSLQIKIEEPPLLLLESCSEEQAADDPDQSNGMAAVSWTGGTFPYNLSWSGPVSGNQGVTSETSFDIEGLAAGDYSLTLTDNNGCAATCSFTITGPECDLEVTVQATTVSCAGAGDGSIDLSFSGGTPPMTFDWNVDNLDGIEDPTGLSGGEYEVTVTDEQGCRVIASVALIEPDSLVFSVVEQEADKSEKTDTGVAGVSISGGVAPYALTWSGPKSGGSNFNEGGAFSIDNLKDGQYTFTLVDSSGCQVARQANIRGFFVVEANDLFVLEFAPDAELTFIDSLTNAIAILAQVEKPIKECNCMDEQSRLQLWRSNAIIEINTSSQGATTKVEVDTSGLGDNLVLAEPIEIGDPDAPCVQPAGNQGPKVHTVKVAVIDTGMDLPHPARNAGEGHPMLEGLAWWNTEEIINRLDDDGNCLDDDLTGYDYLNQTSSVVDVDGHGTHLAGTIADAFPDSVSLELINLKIYSDNQGSVFDLVCAIHYAIDKGADVINLSLGYEHEDYSKPLYNALKRAQDDTILVIVSAGNDTMNLDTGFVAPEFNRWPVRFKANQGFHYTPLTNILVVASLDADETDLDTTFSNYGMTLVDIATRGTIRSTHLNNGEMTLQGTSMSAAYASRLAAVAKVYKPLLEPHEIIKCIKDSSDLLPLGSKFLGSKGKLNIGRALHCLGIDNRDIVRYSAPEINARGGIQYSSLQFQDTLTITLGDGNTYYDDVTFTVTDGNQPLFSFSYCAAKTIVWDARGPDGAVIPDGVYFIQIQVGATTFNPQKIIKY